VPQALADAQQRMVNMSPVEAAPPAITRAVPTGMSGTSTTQKGKGVATDALYGCNNGCCDPDWLVNDMCPQFDYSWFYFNSTWSWYNSNNDDVWTSDSFACAAIGWSHLRVSIGGTDYAYWIPEANYQYVHWIAGTNWHLGWDTKQVVSKVNLDPTDTQNVNTHCGGIDYD